MMGIVKAPIWRLKGEAVMKKLYILAIAILCIMVIVQKQRKSAHQQSISTETTRQQESEYNIYFENLENEARKGNAEAQYMLGYMYYCGQQVEQNYILAAQLFQDVAKQKDEKATFF